MTPEHRVKLIQDRMLEIILKRLQQHKDNLALWDSGALRPTVEDDDEQRAVMHDLRVAIYELETVLISLCPPSR